MISLKAHNIADYIGAIFLILAPFLFGFYELIEARTLFISVGIALAAYSLLTKYYYSALRVIPLGVHMALDVMAGAIVLIAPYFWGYRTLLTDGQFALHVAAGLGVFGLVAFTRTKTEADKTLEERRDTAGDHFTGTGIPGASH